jgi:isoquinoline 1-oxidoreductase
MAQARGSSAPLATRLLLNKDGTFTAMSGKVEEGQGPRTELTQAAAEELRVAVDRVHLVMADTELVPDDGITAGSRTTPRNVPEMREASAIARELLTRLAAQKWNVEPRGLEVRGGLITNPHTGASLTYADLAKSEDVATVFQVSGLSDVEVTEVAEWKVLGQSVDRINALGLVTGKHQFPSDIRRQNMLYGKVLRPPSSGATLESIYLSASKTMKEVIVVHEGQFVGFAAPSSQRAEQALKESEKTASWKASRQTVSNATLHSHLKESAREDRARVNERGSVQDGFGRASQILDASYTLAYVQHAPMEPRAAVAEWNNGSLTVWAGCDGPYRARRDLSEEFGLPAERVRVIVSDMGGGFGGKHTAEAALEAARLAKAAGRPVSVRWTRTEEFTWAYCRPAALIECKAGLNDKGSLVAWDFTNINAGGSAIDAPYNIPNTRIASVGSDSPLRQGSYRCLGATGNNFARESFMDELAVAANTDPLSFRLAHINDPRLRTVLETAARHFNWLERSKKVTSEMGVGLACGTEKNSYVAACVEVAVDRRKGTIRVVEICETFECGPILNPANLLSQVQGCIVMGLGGALTEEIRFKDGKIQNPRFSAYQVPRFGDVPKIDIHLIENQDISPAGGGETPIIAVAPAIGNAVFAATGIRVRSMPLRSEALVKG